MARFTGYIQDGQLFLDDGCVRRYNVLYSRLEGKRIELHLGKERVQRTLSQNSYLHVCIKKLADHLGYDEIEMKGILRYRFLQIHHDDGTVEARSTADLDTAEMTRFIDDIRRLAAELGKYIGSPGEEDEE